MLPSNRGTFGDVQAMTPFPEWVHDLAYQLWAWSCSQNSAKVANLLNTGTYRDDGGFVPESAMVAVEETDKDGELTVTLHNPVLDITRQAINGWKIREDWENRRITQLQEISPAVHAKVAGNISMDTIVAQELIADIAAGRIIADPKTLQIRLQAAQDILNRGGHMPHTRPKDGTALPGPSINHAKSIAGMSRDEKRALALSGGKPHVASSGMASDTVTIGSEMIIEVASPDSSNTRNN